MLKIENCTKKFKRKRALDGFSAQIDGRGAFGLLGPNGAGKTTLLRCVCGLYRPDGGKIEKPEGFIGYLPQKFGMFKELTVYEMMSYFATLKKIEKQKQKEQIEQCVEEVNLTDRLHDRISTLSGGMVRRIGVAQALLGNPELILFDEPTAGLDPEERMRFKNTLARIKESCTVVISTHIVSNVEAVCDRILIMDAGRLAANGTGAEIAQLAQGKVYLLEAQRENELTGSFFVKDRIEDNGRAMLRVLSSSKQPGEKQTPTVEDGFLCALKKL